MTTVTPAARLAALFASPLSVRNGDFSFLGDDGVPMVGR